MSESWKRTIARGLTGITAIWAAPLLAALAGDAWVGLPGWLIYAPVACWGFFVTLYLAVAICLSRLLDTAPERP